MSASFNDRTDRIVRLDGTLIYGDLTPKQAEDRKDQLQREGTSYRHHRYCGERTAGPVRAKEVGWNSVSGYDVTG